MVLFFTLGVRRSALPVPVVRPAGKHEDLPTPCVLAVQPAGSASPLVQKLLDLALAVPDFASDLDVIQTIAFLAAPNRQRAHGNAKLGGRFAGR